MAQVTVIRTDRLEDKAASPLLPDWPAGLVVHTVLQGDVVQSARSKSRARTAFPGIDLGGRVQLGPRDLVGRIHRARTAATSTSQAAAPGPSARNAASSAEVALGVRSPSVFSRGG